MLYDVIIDEWGGTSYVPTALGNALLALIILALLGGAMALARAHEKSRPRTNARGNDKSENTVSAGKHAGRLTREFDTSF